MATVTRRYVDVGTTDAALGLFVPTGVVALAYPRATVDVTIDNDPDTIETLDAFMRLRGLIYSATASPDQVFRYVANGGEGNVLTINAAAGFIERVTANYNVQVELMRSGASALKIVTVVAGSLTVSEFQVELSAAIEAGDILAFTVADLT